MFLTYVQIGTLLDIPVSVSVAWIVSVTGILTYALCIKVSMQRWVFKIIESRVGFLTMQEEFLPLCVASLLTFKVVW